MKANKFFLAIIFFMNYTFVFAQVDKEKIVRAFDKVEYYPNMTIKKVYSKKYFRYNGYAIEFDTLGNPIAIGEYWKGKKFSWWIKPDNSNDNYLYGGYLDEMIKPTCSAGAPKDFKQLYYSLLANKGRLK